MSSKFKLLKLEFVTMESKLARQIASFSRADGRHVSTLAYKSILTQYHTTVTREKRIIITERLESAFCQHSCEFIMTEKGAFWAKK